MATNVFEFKFGQAVSTAEAEMSLHLATYAVEGLYGEARVRLDSTYCVDEAQRTITVDSSTDVGTALVKVFTRLLIREFGEDGFHVRPVPNLHVQTQA